VREIFLFDRDHVLASVGPERITTVFMLTLQYTHYIYIQTASVPHCNKCLSKM